jgi:ABC-type uncharacterized transport system auxiliary subunit
MTRPAMRTALLSFAALGAASLSGCVSVLPEPVVPDALISLPAERAMAPSAPLKADVNVFPPDASVAFAGLDIAVRDQQEIVYLTSMKWSDTPARLLQSAVVNALSAGQGPGRASSAQLGVRSDYDVRWRLIDLSVSKGAGPAVAAAQVSVASSKDRRIIAQKTIRAEAPSASAKPRDRAAALAVASQSLADQIAAFVTETTPEAARP